MITKYLEGTDTNNAIEITNRTGHAVNLNKYRLSIQFYASNYYFPAPYELEGIVENNETFVVLNPRATFTCITNDEARFVTAAPQLTFSGSQYLELRYISKTIDALGTKGTNNFDVLGNKSLYRLPAVTEPNSTFTISEWQSYPADYCENLGVLAASNVTANSQAKYSVYPNPVVSNSFSVKGKNLEQLQELSIFDLSGKLLQQEHQPFKTKSTVNVQNLKSGIYMVKIDGQSLKIIKK